MKNNKHFVKVIEGNDISEQLAEIKYPIKKGGSAWMPTSHDCNQANKQEAFIEGYKKAKENTYTLEQLKEAILFGIGFSTPLSNFTKSELNSVENYIASLNKYKVEITFDENNIPLTAKFL